VVKLDKEVTLIVNAGECQDVVDHDQGFTALEATFAPGLVLPIITLNFNLIDQSDVRCFRQGEKVTLIFGVESGDVHVNGIAFKTKILSASHHYTLVTTILVGADFANEFYPFFFEGKSVGALAALLGRYFPTTVEARPTSDYMRWMSYAVAKRTAMNIWFRSWYGGSNYLLLGIDPWGARIIDMLTAAGSIKWKLGDQTGDDALVDMVKIENRKPLVQDGLDRDVISDRIIKNMGYRLYKPDPHPILVSEIRKWRKGRRRLMEWQYSCLDGPVHASWSNALAANTSYFSVLRPVVRVSFQGYLPIRIFDGIYLDVRDMFPKLELSGKYIAGDITYRARAGRFDMSVGLMREELVI